MQVKDRFHSHAIIAAVIYLFNLYILQIVAKQFTRQTRAFRTEKENFWFGPRAKMCDGGFSERVRVCWNPKNNRSRDVGLNNLGPVSVIFIFNGHLITMVLSRNQVYHPGAYLSINKESKDVTFFDETISNNINHYFIGTFTAFNISVPITAEVNKTSFYTIVFFFDVKIELSCPREALDYLLESQGCSRCDATCIFHKTTSDDQNPTSNDTTSDSRSPIRKVATKSAGGLYVQHSYVDHKIQSEELKSQDEGPSQDTTFRKPDDDLSKPVSCSLHVVADRSFFIHVAGGDTIKAVNHMLSMVNKADAIFRSTDIDGDGQADNIGFLVKKVTINDSSSETNANSVVSMSSMRYLEHFSHNNFGEYCLGVAFTYTDFKGTAGSSYPAFSYNYFAGGICQKVVHRKSKAMSFNTIVITYQLEGQRRSSLDVLLTLVHEFGHSFGARHDNEAGCSGKKTYGRYIMSKVTNHGFGVNNLRFSTCSLKAMLPVIIKKGLCLLRQKYTPFCGNGFPEEGEECDCGWSANCEQVDPCCTPADVRSGIDRPCTIRRSQGKLCSPRVSPCCAKTCTYIPITKHKTCTNLRQCSNKMTCNGSSPHCPESLVPDGTMCNGGIQVCLKGECSMGTCAFYNLSACICTRNRCDICCKNNDSCTPFRNLRRVLSIETIGNDSACWKGNCTYVEDCKYMDNFKRLSRSSLLGILNDFKNHIKTYWLHYSLFGAITIFVVTILTLSYSFEESAHMKAFRYGKMLAICSQGEQLEQTYDKILHDIDVHYTEAIRRAETGTLPMEFIEAIARLKALFPHVSLEYLSRIVKLSATEEVAVRILLIQGFKMRTFSK